MSTLTFPTSKIAPVEDQTERAWNQQVAMLAKAFEDAAFGTTNCDRLARLHERLRGCLQTLNDADEIVRARWDDVVKGL